VQQIPRSPVDAAIGTRPLHPRDRATMMIALPLTRVTTADAASARCRLSAGPLSGSCGSRPRDSNVDSLRRSPCPLNRSPGGPPSSPRCLSTAGRCRGAGCLAARDRPLSGGDLTGSHFCGICHRRARQDLAVNGLVNGLLMICRARFALESSCASFPPPLITPRG
jgi:hypothetical protein